MSSGAREFAERLADELENRYARQNGSTDRFLRIAGRALKIRFAGAELASSLMPALEHLVVSGSGPAAFTIAVLYGSDLVLPPSPSDRWRYFGDGLKFIFQRESSRNRTFFELFDEARNTAYFFIDDPARMESWEIGAPLRTLFYFWAKKEGLQLVHAGAIGSAENGALLVGKGGSGKSTVAVSSLFSDLMYAGDDYVLIDAQKKAVFSLYNSAKLDANSLSMFPELSPLVSNVDRAPDEKALLFLHENFGHKLSSRFSIRAIFVPEVSDSETTSIEPISAVHGLSALAPSTVFQMLHASEKNGDDFHAMAELVRKTPTFRLKIGRKDVRRSAKELAAALEVYR